MDQLESWVWLFSAGLFFFGVAAGFALGRVNDTFWRRSQTLEKELEDLSNEFESYRSDVTQHFVTTAQLINNMTQTYQAMYDHLAANSHKLCGDQLSNALDFNRQQELLKSAQLDNPVSQQAEPSSALAPKNESKVKSQQTPTPRKKASAVEKQAGKAVAAQKQSGDNVKVLTTEPLAKTVAVKTSDNVEKNAQQVEKTSDSPGNRRSAPADDQAQAADTGVKKSTVKKKKTADKNTEDDWDGIKQAAG